MIEKIYDYSKNIWEKNKAYLIANKFFMCAIIFFFIFMGLSVIYFPFVYLSALCVLTGAIFCNVTQIIIFIILNCFCFNGLVETDSLFGINIGLNSVIFGTLTFILATKYIVKVFKEKKKINVKLAVVCALFLLYAILPIYKFKVNIVWIFCIIIGLYCIFEMREEIDFKLLVTSMFIGISVSTILSFIVRLSPDKNSELGSFFDYGLIKFQALFFNPNFLSIFCILLSSALFLMQIKKWSYARLLSIIIIFGLGYSTISRTFLICFFCEIVLYFILIIIKLKKKAFKQILFTIIAMLTVCIVLFPYSEIYFKRLNDIKKLNYNFSTEIDSENNSDVEIEENDGLENDELENEQVDITDETIEFDNPDRSVLFKLYWKDYTSSTSTILFGRGIYASYIANMPPHNSYLGLLWNVGIVGTVLFLGLFAILIILLKPKIELLLLFLIPFLIVGMVETLFFSTWLWLLIVLIIGGSENGKN